MLIGRLSSVWWVTNGATAAVLESDPQQITGRWPSRVTPHALSQSHLQRPPERQSPRIWSEPVRLSHLGIISPSSPSPLDLTPLPDEHDRSGICLRGEHVPVVQLQQQSTLPCITAGLLSLSPRVGYLCARDQTQRELFPQRVHRVCDHQMQASARRGWWNWHSHLPFRPLHGAWWWHTLQRAHGESPVV